MGFRSASKSQLEVLQDQHGRVWVKQSELVCKIMRLEGSLSARPNPIKESVLLYYKNEHDILKKELEHLGYMVDRYKENWNDGF